MRVFPSRHSTESSRPSNWPVQATEIPEEPVVDEGDFLLVRSERHQERVPLGSIAGVLDGPTMRPFQITLNLDQPCRFGQKITFIPRYRLVWNGLHPLVDELRSRVEAVRGNRPEMNSKKAEPGAAADGGGG